MMYNFRNYLLDIEVWEKLHFKNKKAFKNALAVMYGRKKDRGGLRKKILKIRKEYEEEKKLFRSALRSVAPSLSNFLSSYDSFYNY